MERRIQLVNPNVTIDYNTYTASQKACRMFEAGYGEFWCVPRSIIDGLTKGHPDGTNARRVETCLEVYGVEYATQAAVVKQKTKATILEVYGVEHHLQAAESLNKQKQTNITRYGVENISQVVEIKEKKCATTLEHYGVDNPNKSQVVRDRIKKTTLEVYGVGHHMHDLTVALKVARSLNNHTLAVHWKTGEELLCQASYEAAVVEYFNANHIEFLWQPEVFHLPNGKTYRPDAYLIIEDKWIEIKGYFRENAKEKWHLFQAEHPNSELWDKAKLKELQILK